VDKQIGLETAWKACHIIGFIRSLFASMHPVLRILLVSFHLSWPCLLEAEIVRIYYSRQTPQHGFAANDIKKALKTKGHDATVDDLGALARDADVAPKIIIATQADTQVLSALEAEGGSKLGELKAQGYALRTTDQKGRSYWVIGGDANGAMYGGLQLAEELQFHGLDKDFNVEEAPHIKNRGIKFNIPLDEKSPTYFYGHKGSSHKLAIRDVWDMGFWETWFDEMARHRYNVLSLWSPHPFTSMVNMEDEYPGIAINGVTGFDEAGHEVRINDWTIERKIDFWRQVMKYGRERGFDLYMCNWNVFLSTAEDQHGLTDETDNPKTRAYLLKCVVRLFETYPDLKGFGITVGEKMGKLDTRQREQWAWDCFGKGIMEYALAHPKRDIVFIHRQHDGDIDHIIDHFAQLNDLPNVRMDLSCKYSEAHAHSTVTPSRWRRTGMEDGLAKHGLMSWLTIRNDDFYYLHWAEPQFVRDYIRGFPEIDSFVNGFYIGADGWVFAKEFVSKHPYYRDQGALSIQRTWYMQKLWGRISYNPEIPDDFFVRHLSRKFPEVPPEKLFDAWSSASGAIRRANEQVTGKWQFDADFWPELWTGDMWGGSEGRRFTVEDTKDTTPFAGSSLASLRETAEGKIGRKISAWDNIAEIDRLSQHALVILAELKPANNVELQLTIRDLTAQAHLGQFNANHYKTVIHVIKGEHERARETMGKAYKSWITYSQIMHDLYKPADMQRNRDFESWREFDEVVEKDFETLKGAGAQKSERD
jgi:hypothetical protein